MKMQTVALTVSLFTFAFGAINRTFPSAFKFGVATAAYQVEGAWDEDGKTANIWDYICHTNPTFIDEEDNGDVACDSYHKFDQDLQMLSELGVNHYRFSISWTRLIPAAFAGSPVNQKAVDYYNSMIDGLRDRYIEPLVTIFHWDTPQILQDIGGFPNEEIIEHYVYFARTVFELFGDRVKLWITFNEPKQTCYQGYGIGVYAPGVHASGIADYQCTHNLLKAHAQAYHLYDDEFRDSQGGKVGITMDSSWFEPLTDSAEDQEAAERALEFNFGWFANPIFRSNYPQVMIDRIAARSEAGGYRQSRLPVFTDEELEYISGTHDFLGFNHYTTYYAQYQSDDFDDYVNISMDSDLNVGLSQDESWESSASPWLKVVPWGIRRLLNWVYDKYQTEILITENGVSDSGNLLHDDVRVRYYAEYMSNVLEALLDDGVTITGYTAWSLMDNFEWARGYTEKYGLYSVDFDSPNRTRTPKDSAAYFAKVLATHCLVDFCED